jgi:hypothetical protein
MRDTDDDRIYFADPDKLDSITIDVSSKRTGSSAYINEFKSYSITKENDYRLRDKRNRVLHETEHSVAPDLQMQFITADFDRGPAGLSPAAKLYF